MRMQDIYTEIGNLTDRVLHNEQIQARDHDSIIELRQDMKVIKAVGMATLTIVSGLTVVLVAHLLL